MQRYGWIIGLRPDRVEDYKREHAAVWPDVLRMIKEVNIRNYSIFLREFPDGSLYLFSYLEYTGDDLQADMAKMAADPVTQEWWKVCMPMQMPIANAKEGEWWSDMEEVFHCD